MAKVLIKKLNPKVELPAYKTDGASGMDLMAFIEEPIRIAPNSSYLVPTGLSMAFQRIMKFKFVLDLVWLLKRVLQF